MGYQWDINVFFLFSHFSHWNTCEWKTRVAWFMVSKNDVKQGCRLSRRPQKGQRVISLCFFEICFLLWFRSDSLSVSPEPGLQIHCVFQGFLFLFSNVLFFFFPCKLSFFFFLKVRKKTYFFLILCSRYTYTHIYIHIYIYMYVCMYVYLSIYLSISLSIYLSIYLSTYYLHYNER